MESSWPGPSCALNQHLFGGPGKSTPLWWIPPWGTTAWPWRRWFQREAHAPPFQKLRRIDLNAQQMVHANKKAANTSDYSNCFHCVSVTSDLRLDKSQVLNRWSLTTTFTVLQTLAAYLFAWKTALNKRSNSWPSCQAVLTSMTNSISRPSAFLVAWVKSPPIAFCTVMAAQYENRSLAQIISV